MTKGHPAPMPIGADVDRTGGSIPPTGAKMEIFNEILTALRASTRNLREAAEYIEDSLGDGSTASHLLQCAVANEKTIIKMESLYVGGGVDQFGDYWPGRPVNPKA